MEQINELIARLVAIENFCKDIHYTNKFYEDHLLADRIHDGISTHIDDLKEQAILSKRTLPLASKEYLKKAVEFIPDLVSQNAKTEVNRANWVELEALISGTVKLLNTIKVDDRGINSLLDSIAQDLNTDKALIFIQARSRYDINEAIDKDHAAATETPIDRREFKAEEIKPSPEQALALKYDAENVLVAEEDILDKLTRDLGIDTNEN